MSKDNNKTMQGKGYVKWVGSRPYGSTMSWTFRLKNTEMWFNCGGQSPNVEINDHIEFDYVDKNGRAAVNVGSIKKLSADAQVHQGTPSTALAHTPHVGGGREEYWNDKASKDVEKDLRIQWQSARNAAIEVTSLLVTADALKLPEKNKGEAILGKIADLTEKFYRESAEPISLEVVDDAASSDSEAA